MVSLSRISAIAHRELVIGAATPAIPVFLALFSSLAVLGGLYLNGIYAAEVADLGLFFESLPWLFVFFVPALTMNTWSVERRDGTLEVLLATPISDLELTAGKFFGLWALGLLGLGLTLPIWPASLFCPS